ncbi:hypothetical protein H310_06336 [Aphanomyces invadans]|uniref:DUF7769 domain-containing protein n=1 Tax=Aphanomyces invadans TaxID=157072 RepID=A0A024U5N8_9STRA|nr:hypothetical protein H310_06336 [Aphanomyces invadans]ETW01731.1 hypothetical protein H310_06336 [Aphanomyces invadans]|eukprot:XP_008869579.1 hypothetical protein H310_06336 [Aphanomyces invadans]
MSTSHRQSRELRDVEKREVATALQDCLSKGKLPRGTIKAADERFQLHRSTVRQIWSRYKDGITKNLKVGRVGPKKHYTKEEIVALIRAVPLNQRNTFRELSKATGMSTFKLSRALKNGVFQRRSSRLKPLLTNANKHERLAFCGAHIPKAGTLQESEFSGMWDVVHLDEKWFNADKDCHKEYLVEGEFSGMWDVEYLVECEEVQRRACKSKRFIPKVMFLCAVVARPQMDVGYDGKIGL